MTDVLRCRDLRDALACIAALYGVSAAELERALPLAALEAHEDREDPRRAFPSTLTNALGRTPAAPARIHYFHGTRARKPNRFLHEGLRPLGQVLDSLWRDVGALVPELSRQELSALRADLGAGRIGPDTYSLRVEDRPDEGPCGHLLRDMFLHPDDYASVHYLAGAEIVIDICQAIEERTGIDATTRYRRETTPCIIEFSVPTTDFDNALLGPLVPRCGASRRANDERQLDVLRGWRAAGATGDRLGPELGPAFRRETG